MESLQVAKKALREYLRANKQKVNEELIELRNKSIIVVPRCEFTIANISIEYIVVGELTYGFGVGETVTLTKLNENDKTSAYFENEFYGLWLRCSEVIIKNN